VDEIIRNRDLPTSLAGPVSLFSQQATVQEQIQARGSIVGVRNSVLFTAYRTRTEPIPGTAAELLAPAQIDNTQTGASVVWSHQLTPLYTLATSADWSRAVANDASGRRTEQATLQILLSAPISVLTTIVTGIRHQRITSNLEADIRETEVFVGMNHLFR